MVSQDHNHFKAVKETTTMTGTSACKECMNLQYCFPLVFIMQWDSEGGYGSTPDALCQVSVILSHIFDIHEKQRILSVRFRWYKKAISMQG